MILKRTWMTQHTDIFISDVEDLIAAGWPTISAVLLRDWTRLSPTTISNIRGRAHLLTSALSITYDISAEKAERITLKLARDFDYFEETSAVFSAMQKYWPGFSREDFLNVKGRKSVLVSILQSRYSLSRSHGWLQIERFFAQLT